MISNKYLWHFCELLYNNPSIVNFHDLSTLIYSNKALPNEVAFQLKMLVTLDSGITSTVASLQMDQYIYQKENGTHKELGGWFRKHIKDIIKNSINYNRIVFLIVILYGIKGYKNFISCQNDIWATYKYYFFSELDRSEARLIFEEELKKSLIDIRELDDYYLELVSGIEQDFLCPVPISKVFEELSIEGSDLNKKFQIYKNFRLILGKIDHLKKFSIVIATFAVLPPTIFILLEVGWFFTFVIWVPLGLSAASVGNFLFHVCDNIINKKNNMIREELIQDFYSSS